MRIKKLQGLLILQAVICMGLVLFNVTPDPIIIISSIAFPFEQIGIILQYLSLASDITNIIAIILYGLICMFPIILLFVLHKKQKAYKEDYYFLNLLSFMLFIVIYLMINPNDITRINVLFNKAVLGLIMYSIIIGYFVLRMLRIFIQNKNKLNR